jgi:N4-gp56 family major capsid protein
MATFSTATSNFADLVQETVKGAAEEELRSKLVHAMPGNYIRSNFIPGTDLVRIGRYADGAAQTAALTEGTAPTAQALTIASEAFTATQVGGVWEWTDLAELDSPHNVVAINADKAGRQAALTIDTLVREVLNAGTSVLYVAGAARSALAASDKLTGAFIKKVVRNLSRNNVPTFGDGFYRAIIHPDVTYDLFTDTADGGWMDASKYTDSQVMKLLTGEMGRYHRVRFLETSEAKTFASTTTVYSTFVFGPGAYTLADSQNLASYFVPAGGHPSDPLAQKNKIGWKVRFGSMLVDEAGPRYVRIESGVTA